MKLKKLLNNLYEHFIFREYKRLAKKHIGACLALYKHEVKKGKIRYTLLIYRDDQGKTVFNLGRHGELTPKQRPLLK